MDLILQADSELAVRSVSLLSITCDAPNINWLSDEITRGSVVNVDSITVGIPIELSDVTTVCAIVDIDYRCGWFKQAENQTIAEFMSLCLAIGLVPFKYGDFTLCVAVAGSNAYTALVLHGCQHVKDQIFVSLETVKTLLPANIVEAINHDIISVSNDIIVRSYDF